ncbi:methyltransferase domain-containing protein [Nonomuraea sp. NPDC049714]|uniref:class I SAM-dependent methyltransferase n=1 Tax=Nonomuraea sp. NPDC049714 TaxID=3364357 RepID=UPI0037ADF83A
MERTLAWLTACRRLARDYERDPKISEAIIRWAAIAGNGPPSHPQGPRSATSPNRLRLTKIDYLKHALSSTGMSEIDYLTVNRANWNGRVDIHVTSDFYDVPGFKAGADPLRDFEIDEVGDVTGKSLVHLQCHFGLDTLAWARRGAQVSGLDLSEKAIETATALAQECGLQARFVAADVYDAPTALKDTYDIVYTGIGALVWLPDLWRWAEVVATLLKPGGLQHARPVGWIKAPFGLAVGRVLLGCGDVPLPGQHLERLDLRSVRCAHLASSVPAGFLDCSAEKARNSRAAALLMYACARSRCARAICLSQVASP